MKFKKQNASLKDSGGWEDVRGTHPGLAENAPTALRSEFASGAICRLSGRGRAITYHAYARLVGGGNTALPSTRKTLLRQRKTHADLGGIVLAVGLVLGREESPARLPARPNNARANGASPWRTRPLPLQRRARRLACSRRQNALRRRSLSCSIFRIVASAAKETRRQARRPAPHYGHA